MPKFFNSLSKRRGAREAQARNQSSKKIQVNTRTLIDELSSVDFLHTGLPEYVLNDRRDEDMLPQICTLEWDCISLIQLLRNDCQEITMDIRPIDEKLMTLVLMFKQHVALGEVTAARTAMDALKVGINDIRCKLPLNQPELAEAFVEQNTEYLARWITLVEFSKNYDHTGEALDIAKAAAQDARECKAQQSRTIEHRIQTEPDFAEAFFKISVSEDCQDWTGLEREVYDMIAKAKREDSNINLHTRQVAVLESDLSTLRQQMDSLRSFLNAIPMTSSGSLMNKYQEAMAQYAADTNARPSAWEQIAPGYPDFDELPDHIKARIILAVQDILGESQSRSAFEQEPSEMSVEDLCKELFGEEGLAQMRSFPGTYRPRKFRNPLKDWRERRNQEQKTLEEKAVQNITGKAKYNSLNLFDELSSVDFLHTGLPDYVLNDRREEAVLPMICTLEWDTRSLIQLIRDQLIRDDRQEITMDIRPIDEKLMALVLMFKQYVAHGNVMAARMAMDALKVGINDIRCKLPLNQPELAEAFVEQNTEYLARWITLVEFSKNYDLTGENLDIAKAAAQDVLDRREQQIASIEQRIRSEADFAEAFFDIHDGVNAADPASWTDLEDELNDMLSNANLEDLRLIICSRQVTFLENELSFLRHQMDSLRIFLNKKPDVANESLMNEYQEAMKQFVNDLAESDTRMEETINMVDQLTVAMAQLDESQGHRLAMEAAKGQANKIMDEILEKQKDQTGMTEEEHARRMKERGLKTPEQLAAETAAILAQLEAVKSATKVIPSDPTED